MFIPYPYWSAIFLWLAYHLFAMSSTVVFFPFWFSYVNICLFEISQSSAFICKTYMARWSWFFIQYCTLQVKIDCESVITTMPSKNSLMVKTFYKSGWCQFDLNICLYENETWQHSIMHLQSFYCIIVIYWPANLLLVFSFLLACNNFYSQLTIKTLWFYI